jgi:hypothetical protein
MRTALPSLALASTLLCACTSSVDEQASASGAGGSAGAGGSTATSCPGVDLTSDPQQCGSCGHSCLGGSCVAGACQAFKLANVSGQSGFTPTALALDADHVYVGVNPSDSEPGGMFVVPRAGGTATMLTDKNQIVTALAVTASTLCWAQYSTSSTSTAGLYCMPLDGSSEPSLFLVAGVPVVDDNFIYAARGNEVVRMPPSGGTPFVIGQVSPASDSTGIEDIAIDSDSVYVAIEGTGHDPGSVQAFPKGGGQPSFVFHRSPVIDIAVNSGFLYVDGPCGLCRLPSSGGSQRSIPIDPPIPLADRPPSGGGFRQFAVDNDWVYMVGCNASSTGYCDETKANQIHRVPFTGGADHPVTAGVFAEEIAVDDQALVWADSNGDIWQLAK